MTTSSDSTQTVGARERLLDAAEELTYAGGIHATGVGAIVRQSGTARKSFYTHFESKDALVAAALEQRDERWMNWFIAGTSRHGRTPRTRLIGMFDVLREWFVSDDFHGCAFLNASGEIAAAETRSGSSRASTRNALLQFVRSVCDEYIAASGESARHAARLSRQWLILIDGAIGVALVSGDPDAALDARAAAERLLDSYTTAGHAATRRRST